MKDFHGIIFAYNTFPELRELVKSRHAADASRDDDAAGGFVEPAIGLEKIVRRHAQNFFAARFDDVD